MRDLPEENDLRLPYLPLTAVLAALVLLAACAGAPASPAPTNVQPSPAAGQPSPTAAATSPATPAPATVEPVSPAPAEPLNVVTSTTVLADLVRQVGGERVSVQSIIPAGRDPHTFEPAPSDAISLAGANLLVINGLGLDDGLEDLASETAPDVPLVVLAEGLEGVEYLEGDDDHDDDDDDDDDDEDHDDDDHGHAINPHLWLDVANTRLYVERLTATLSANDEAGRQTYEANAAAYDSKLAELDEWIGQEIGALSAENRRVISFHDAFPYFAHAYGIEIVGVVVESPGQEPSAAEIAQLITAIREANARAVLSEVQFGDRLAQVIADETSITVIHELYTDSLGDPPLDTYEAAMRWNVERILEGLR
ncbi:metal ABC transporter substrate-binding protein [soil metagenome]